MKFSFRVNPSTLALCSAAFLTVAYNALFWNTFMHAVGGLHADNALSVVGTFLILVLVFNAFLSLVNFRYVLKPVLIALFLITSAATYFMNQYGTSIDASMIQNVMETDMREARELLNWRLLSTMTLLGIVPSLILWRVDVPYGGFRQTLMRRLGMLTASLAGAMILLVLCFKTLAPTVREHRELRFMLTPTNYIQAVSTYLKRKHSQQQVVVPLGRDAVKGDLWAAGEKHKTVSIIIVGETARAMNFSLNGYARNTNPELSKESGLINFHDVYSCGTATAISVPCVFSLLDREHYSEEKAKSQEGLLDVLAHAGLKVIWLDNNSGCKGACDRVQFQDMSQPAAGDPLCNAEECYDERMLRDLPRIVRESDKDLVIVLHQKGSHGPAYWKRYPAAFNRFTPVCQTNELEKCSTESIINAYDNTILYTDHFIAKAIDILRQIARQNGADTSLIYFSDHGESLGEKNMYLHGAPYIISPEEQRHVPFMVWLGDSFRSRFRIDERCLAARVDQPFSHDNVFHSVLGMLDIRTAVYDPALDLFHACMFGI